MNFCCVPVPITNIRVVDTNGLFNEGGVVSRMANHIPGVNAVAGLHDVFQINLNGWSRNALNVPGMFVAAPITGAALMHGSPAVALSCSGIVNLAT